MEKWIGLALQAATVVLLALILLRPNPTVPRQAEAPDYSHELEVIGRNLEVICLRMETRPPSRLGLYDPPEC